MSRTLPPSMAGILKLDFPVADIASSIAINVNTHQRSL